MIQRYTVVRTGLTSISFVLYRQHANQPTANKQGENDSFIRVQTGITKELFLLVSRWHSSG